MRVTKWLGSSLLILIIIIALSACGSSLKKPTGLEANNNHDETASLDEGNTQETPEKSELEKNSQNKNENGKAADEESNSNDDKLEEHKDNNDNDNAASNDKSNDQEDVDKSSSKKKTSTHETKDRKASNKSTNKSDKKKKKDISNKKGKKKKKNNFKKQKDTSETKDNSNKNKEKSKKESNQEKDKPRQDPKPQKDTIVHSIVISEETNEIPLPPTEMEIKEGDTILEALISITKKNKIQMDYRGGQGSTAYVQGMGNVYEFDRGQGSGWMYSINGIFPDRGAGVVPLCDGDRVEWLYTTNLGKDLGADLKPVRRDGKCP